MSKSWGMLACVLLAAGPAAADSGAWDVSKVRNLKAVPGLKAAHKDLLGMAAFAVEGQQADVAGAAVLARVWLGSKAGREGLERLMQVRDRA
jgi:hypothetical protein